MWTGFKGLNMAKQKLIISNPTTVTRGLMLKQRTIFLQPGEVYAVPLEDQDEVRALFKVRAIQAQVDAGFLCFSDLPDEELKTQKTPKPPASLATTVPVGDTTIKARAEGIQDAGTVEI